MTAAIGGGLGSFFVIEIFTALAAIDDAAFGNGNGIAALVTVVLGAALPALWAYFARRRHFNEASRIHQEFMMEAGRKAARRAQRGF
jgi:hypothetical protein